MKLGTFRSIAAVVACAGCAWVGVASAQQGQVDSSVPANGVTIPDPGVRADRGERPVAARAVVTVPEGVTVFDGAGTEVDPEARGIALPFTYQGRLRNAGLPANGIFNMTFRVFDAPLGGVLLWSNVHFGVPVTNGVFTRDLSFGSGVFDGADRYIKIEVNGNILSPRQKVNPTPYALKADSLQWPVSETIDGGFLNLNSNFDDAAYFAHLDGGINQVYAGSQFAGVEAFSTSQSAVQAVTNTGIGVFARRGDIAGTNPAIWGETNSESSSANAILGEVTSTTPGGFSTALRGINNGTGFSGIGVWGSHAGSGWGVRGTTTSGIAIQAGNASGSGWLFSGTQPGTSIDIGGGTVGLSITESDGSGTNAPAILARQNATGPDDAPAIHGVNDDDDFFGVGVIGEGGWRGVRGHAFGTFDGLYYGLYGDASAGAGGICYSIYGASPSGAGTLWAGYFAGNVRVTGIFNNALSSVRLDHPLDPYNKFLSHSSVVSPDMKNIYDGTAVFNAAGQARVIMPDYFEALNAEFRYQLTAVGAPMPNLYVATEIQNGVFVIAGGVAGAKVSWQVTGTRQDSFARENRLPVEEWKQGREVGKLLHPTAFGRSSEEGIDKSRELEEAAKGNR